MKYSFTRVQPAFKVTCASSDPFLITCYKWCTMRTWHKHAHMIHMADVSLCACDTHGPCDTHTVRTRFTWRTWFTLRMWDNEKLKMKMWRTRVTSLDAFFTMWLYRPRSFLEKITLLSSSLRTLYRLVEDDLLGGHHCDELLVVNLAVSINVSFPDHLVNLLIRQLLS